jgi:ABC-type Mn2+/Zn2+ transport system ATPase subunit
LNEKRDAPFAKFSRGMKRTLTIVAALAHHPSHVFLDEPTTGLDVMSARNLCRMIASLRDEGVTIFLTTHYLEEAGRSPTGRMKVLAPHLIFLFEIGRGRVELPRFFNPRILRTPNVPSVFPRGGLP